MRAVLFRGKRHDGIWMYGDLLHSCCNTYTIIQPEMIQRHIVLEETVGQFTGLYDKDGKEIYEGDIIISEELKHTCHYVRYMESEAMFVAMIIGSPLDEYCGIRQSWIDKFSKKIIGNIHDNPELLTNK